VANLASAAVHSQPLARRLTRIAAWIGGVALVLFVLDLLGVPAGDWIRDLFRKVGDVPPWAIVAVFLGAYGIPVSFHNVATVTASNSISNSVSATPGGVGVTQAMNSAALAGSVDASTATAYSIGQQLIVSAWDVVFAVILVCWVFGWSGGKALVESSYADAKVRSHELKTKHKKA
jgi:hypothetical protein